MVARIHNYIFLENAFPSVEEQSNFVENLVRSATFVVPADDLISKVCHNQYLVFNKIVSRT